MIDILICFLFSKVLNNLLYCGFSTKVSRLFMKIIYLLKSSFIVYKVENLNAEKIKYLLTST